MYLESPERKCSEVAWVWPKCWSRGRDACAWFLRGLASLAGRTEAAAGCFRNSSYVSPQPGHQSWKFLSQDTSTRTARHGDMQILWERQCIDFSSISWDQILPRGSGNEQPEEGPVAIRGKSRWLRQICLLWSWQSLTLKIGREFTGSWWEHNAKCVQAIIQVCKLSNDNNSNINPDVKCIIPR